MLAQYETQTGYDAIVAVLFCVLLAFIFGAWSADAAERKGIPRSTGWLFGIFLGLLGRIIIGLMRDRRSQQVSMTTPLPPTTLPPTRPLPPPPPPPTSAPSPSIEDEGDKGPLF